MFVGREECLVLWVGRDVCGRPTRQPVLEASKVGGRWGLSVLEDFDGAAGAHHDGETGGTSDGFLAGCQHDVERPVVEVDLFRADTAHSVHDHERLGADFVHHFRQGLDLAQHTC